jgi:KipI family sensor histidine kinase inhibitor
MGEPRIEPLGDTALLIHLGDQLDADQNARAIAIAATLHAARLPGVDDVAPAYASVCVHYDPLAWTVGADLPYAALAARITALLRAAAAPLAVSIGTLEIPICYGGEYGPDLAMLAAHAGLREDEVIARHCAGDYRVAMLGFAPGFAYLLGLDPALAMPRRANPRVRVPAGSVGIGGTQTGIYSRATPGGWNLIGRTPLALFDPARSPPALLVPGQSLRFRPISTADFTAWPR